MVVRKYHVERNLTADLLGFAPQKNLLIPDSPSLHFTYEKVRKSVILQPAAFAGHVKDEYQMTNTSTLLVRSGILNTLGS